MGGRRGERQIHIPRTDNIDSAGIEVRRASQTMHNPAGGELGRGIDRTAWDVEEGGAGTDEDETGVFGFGTWWV